MIILIAILICGKVFVHDSLTKYSDIDISITSNELEKFFVLQFVD